MQGHVIRIWQRWILSQLQSPHCGWDRQTTIIQCPSPSPSLGLDFCPSPRINIPKKSWDKLVHNCKNSYHHTVVGSRRTFLLRNKRKTIIKSTAKVPDPPIKVTQDLQAAKDRLEALKIPPTNNITPYLRRALHDLKTDHSIVINKADKGSSITILNKIDYIQEGLLHLNDQRPSDIRTTREGHDPTHPSQIERHLSECHQKELDHARTSRSVQT